MLKRGQVYVHGNTHALYFLGYAVNGFFVFIRHIYENFIKRFAANPIKNSR